MTLAAFQQALSLMTLDVAMASAVRHQGASALADFELTALEQRRLLGLAQQDGMELNCTLARANRFAAVHDAFAMSCVLLGPALRGVLDRLWSGRHPANYQLAGDAERFADVAMAQMHDQSQAQVQASLQASADLPMPRPARIGKAEDSGYRPCPYLAEVLAYEQLAYQLALSVRRHREPSRACSAPVWMDFEHDPQAIFDALRRFERPPGNLARVPHRVRLAVVDGELETAIFGFAAPA